MLVALLVLSGCTTRAETGSGESDVPVPPGLEQACPPPDTPLRYPEGNLPLGAVAVRLCPGQPTIAYDGEQLGAPIQAPRDELTVDVDAVVELVNGLPEFEQGTACPFDDGPHHVYWFRYPDGDARAVAYDEAGCHTAVVGEQVAHQDGEELATAFADALFAQRAGSRPPAGTSRKALECPAPPMSEPTSVLPSVPLAMTAATWCVGVGLHTMRSASVPEDLLERLNAGLLGAPAEERDRCEVTGHVTTLEGVTAWGDRVSFLLPGCRVVARTGFGRDTITTEYEADPELVAALQALPVRRWKASG